MLGHHAPRALIARPARCYRIILIAALVVVSPAHAQWVISTERDSGESRISRQNLDGSDRQYLVQEPENPIRGSDVDAANMELYWTTSEGLLRRGITDVTAQPVVLNVTRRGGLTLDVANNHIYFAGGTEPPFWQYRVLGDISRTNLDGTNVTVLVEGVVSASPLVLNHAAGKMCWTQTISGSGAGLPDEFAPRKIMCADLDGTDVAELVVVGAPLEWYPTVLAISPVDGKLYWSDFDSLEIRRANLDGTGLETVLSGFGTGSYIAFDEAGTLYGTAAGSLFLLPAGATDPEFPGATASNSKIVSECALPVTAPEDDCNGNGVHDTCDLFDGTGFNCNRNSQLDECDIADLVSEDCNNNTIPDECDIGFWSNSSNLDCNQNNVPDDCDIASGSSDDCDGDDVPDECQRDCDRSGVADVCEIADGILEDCDNNGNPDICHLKDCNGNGVLDTCDLDDGFSTDCNGNNLPDECDSPDCNGNDRPDSCDIAGGTSLDDNGDGIPDECCTPSIVTVAGPARNRFVSLSDPAVPGVESALRVRILSGDGQTVVSELWVGPAIEYVDETSAPGEPTTLVASNLNCDPHFASWTGVEELNVYGFEIVPGSIYEIQRIYAGCPVESEMNFSPPIEVPTGRFGDVVAPFAGDVPGLVQPDFDDIAGVVQKFLASPTAPSKVFAKLQPAVVRVEQPIDFKDIAASVAAFRGATFAQSQSTVAGAPCTCPPAIPCSTPCFVDSHCSGFICVNGVCADACGRCAPLP